MTWLQRLWRWLDSTITITFGPPFPDPDIRPFHVVFREERAEALAAADVALDRAVVATREFKACPSCHGTDILTGYSVSRKKEEVWCDECGYTVALDGTAEACRAVWNDRKAQER